MSGDARRALDICRRATEVALVEHKSKCGKTSKAASVNASHINRAVQEMFSSPKIVAIRLDLCLLGNYHVCVCSGGGSIYVL